MQFLFYMFSTLMSLEDRLRLKLKVKTLCMAIMLDHPWQSLYTQYGSTVIQSLYTLSHLLVSCPFLLLLVPNPNILLGLVNIRNKGLKKQSWFVYMYFPGAKPVHVHCFTSSTSTYTNVCALWLGLVTQK